MDAVQAIVSLAIEYWRLLRLYERAVMEQEPDKHRKSLAQLRYASNRLNIILEKNGFRLISYNGDQYTPNLPVSVVNGDEISGDENLIIDQTLEPTVLYDGRVLSVGKVVIKKEG